MEDDNLDVGVLDDRGVFRAWVDQLNRHPWEYCPYSKGVPAGSDQAMPAKAKSLLNHAGHARLRP